MHVGFHLASYSAFLHGFDEILGYFIVHITRPKSTANSTDIAVLTVEGVIFKRNRAAGSICAAVELLRVDPCRFSGAAVRSSV